MEKQENMAFEPMPEEPQNPVEEAAGEDDTLHAARRRMLYGLLWCVGGLIFSFVSYYFTEAGGRYIVATGAIVWGAVQAVGGLAAYVRELRSRGAYATARQAVVLGICAGAVIAGLGYASWRTVHADDVEFVQTEQHYECPELGLRLTLPAGFSELAAEGREETDSTYAYRKVSAWNDTRSVMVEGHVGNLGSEEPVRIDGLTSTLAAQAIEFLDGGLTHSGEIVELGNARMFRHVGRRAEYPGWNVVLYDLVHNESLVSIYYYTDSDDAAAEADAFVADHVEFYLE